MTEQLLIVAVQVDMRCYRSLLTLLPLATLVASCTVPSAQASSDGGTGCNGENAQMKVLFTSQTQVASGDMPAVVTIEMPSATEIRDGVLELTVRLLRVDPQRKFIVTATKLGGEQVGQLAFYPPAKPGEVYKFRVEAPKQEGVPELQKRLTLSVALVPISQGLGPLNAAIEVTSAQMLMPKCR